MKKLINLSFILLAFVGLSTMISCDDKKEKDPLKVESAEINVEDYTLWYYFSFETGDVVGTGAADPSAADDATWKARKDWDLAFHRQDVRTNSGTSGDGQGGAQKASSSSLSAIKEAPVSGFAVDDSVSILPKFVMPPKYVKSAGNTLMSKWATHDHTEGWSIVDQAFVVKTADGKYAKVKLANFLNEDNESGHITMEYVYQPDGSTTLE